MTKDELEQRVNEARAKNLEGTVSQKWHDMVEYTLRAEIDRQREAAEGWCGAAAGFVDEIRAAEAEIAKLRVLVAKLESALERAEHLSKAFCDKGDELLHENEKLRAALHKLEPFACVPLTAGQGQDGKWHERRGCRLCGAINETGETVHREDCVFA